jgi:hypothetical protein
MRMTVSIPQGRTIGSAGPLLNPDRPDLDPEAVVLENDAVIVAGLRVRNFTQVEVHGSIIPPILSDMRS